MTKLPVLDIFGVTPFIDGTDADKPCPVCASPDVYEYEPQDQDGPMVHECSKCGAAFLVGYWDLKRL